MLSDICKSMSTQNASIEEDRRNQVGMFGDKSDAATRQHVWTGMSSASDGECDVTRERGTGGQISIGAEPEPAGAPDAFDDDLAPGATGPEGCTPDPVGPWTISSQMSSASSDGPSPPLRRTLELLFA